MQITNLAPQGPVTTAEAAPQKPAAAATLSRQTPAATEKRAPPGDPRVTIITAGEQEKPQDSKEKDETKTLSDTIQQANESFRFQGRNLKFKIDKDTGRTVVQIIDAATDEVIRQIPPQEMLEIAKRLGDSEGVLFRRDA